MLATNSVCCCCYCISYRVALLCVSSEILAIRRISKRNRDFVAGIVLVRAFSSYGSAKFASVLLVGIINQVLAELDILMANTGSVSLEVNRKHAIDATHAHVTAKRIDDLVFDDASHCCLAIAAAIQRLCRINDVAFDLSESETLSAASSVVVLDKPHEETANRLR